MPWECASESESHSKRMSKESGWSVRVRCRIEYMVRNENAAEVGFAWISWMNAGRDWDEIGKLFEGT